MGEDAACRKGGTNIREPCTPIKRLIRMSFFIVKQRMMGVHNRMLQKETRDFSEKGSYKRQQAALQTKAQRRWRVKGSNLNALMNEYSNRIHGEEPSELHTVIDEFEESY